MSINLENLFAYYPQMGYQAGLHSWAHLYHHIFPHPTHPTDKTNTLWGAGGGGGEGEKIYYSTVMAEYWPYGVGTVYLSVSHTFLFLLSKTLGV